MATWHHAIGSHVTTWIDGPTTLLPSPVLLCGVVVTCILDKETLFLVAKLHDEQHQGGQNSCWAGVVRLNSL